MIKSYLWKIKFGGSNRWLKKSDSLWDFIETCELVNLGFSKQAFTWKGLIVVFVIPHGTLNLKKAWVHHVPRVHSDHYPLLINCDDSLYKYVGPKPFHFLSAWLEHPEFSLFVETTWLSDIDKLDHAINNFTQRVCKWNRELFGNIFKQRKQCLARLKGVHIHLFSHRNPHLLALESNLIVDYIEILNQEERFLYQKSRVNCSKWERATQSIFTLQI